MHKQRFVSLFSAISSDDFSPLSSVPLTFSKGSANGAKACTPLTAVADNLVECGEDFTVILELISSGTSIRLGNNSTAVSLIDSDGMLIIMTYNEIAISCQHSSAASFRLTTMATVVEGTSLMMCAHMESAGATLSKEVIVTVSTVDGTG